MADLFLNWRDIAPSTLDDGATTSIETGGVAVDVTFASEDAFATAFTFSQEGYVEEADDLNSASWLKLFDEANNDGLSETSGLTLDFRATDTDLYTDEVQDVSFRINDIDTLAVGADLGDAAAEGFQDIVTVLAFDADGNPVPVTLTPEAGGPAVTDNTAVGVTETEYLDATGSLLVNIDGPVARIVVQYSNGDDAQQAVTVSDVNFTTVDVTNTDPDAVDDLDETPYETAIVVDVLGNDSDPEDDPLTVTIVTDPANGAAVINDDGTVTYTPEDGFSGEDSFDYTISDGNGGEDTATVTITVLPEPNEPPVAEDDTVETPEGEPVTIPVLDNDSDPEDDPLTVTDVSDPPNGTVEINDDGTVTYTPDPGFSGEETITYTVEDPSGNTDEGTITVTVVDNEPPVAEDDTVETPEGEPVTIPVLDNDSDPEDDPLTVTDVSDPPNGTVEINDDGTVTYTPDPGFSGEETITYTIEDPSGNTDEGTITVTVNSAPDAVDDADETPFETPIIVPVLGNDSDPEDDPLTITDVTDPANGTAEINDDGTLTYTPDDGFDGEDTFDYTITDGNGGEDTATVTITVLPEADNPPVAEDDTVETTEDDPVIIPVLGNDDDPDGDPLTITEVTEPANGTAVPNDDGTITYTPDFGFTGEDTFTYTVEDPAGNEDTATVTVDVNAAPDAVDDEETTPLDTPVVISVLDNDSDPDDDPLTIVETTDPSDGSITVNPDGTITYTPDTGFTGEDTFSYVVSDGEGGEDLAVVTVTVGPVGSVDAVDDSDTTLPTTPVVIDVLGNDTDPEGDTITVTSVGDPENGTAVLNDDGTVTYTPDAGFTGEDTFPYTVTDGNGNEDTAIVTVTVNSEPVAEDDAETTTPATPIVIDVLGNDSDPEDDPLTVTETTDPENGDVTINDDGTVTYTPDDGFTGEDTFNYTIDDGNGGEDTATVTVTVNSAPEADDDAETTPLNTPIVISVLENDSDPEDDPLTITGFTDPDNGSVTVNDDGTVTYTPDTGFTGEDTFNYTITDGNGGEDTATVTVTIGENQPPVAVDDTAETDPGQPVTIVPLANDSDPEDDPLTVTGIGTPTNGTAVLNPDGTVTYTPDPITIGEDTFPFIGEDTIPYTIDDGNGGTDTGEIIVTVGGRIDDDIFPVSDALQPLDPFNTLDEDPDVENDRDSVDGTAGDDTISTGDDRDTIIAGGGDDSIRPGIDNDYVELGGGDDSLVDVQGADTIIGGSGDDTIIAGTDTFSNYEGDDDFFPFLGFTSDPNTEDGRDSIQGNNGNDVIFTGDDDDTIDGGQDNDTIDAGIDDDSVTGNQGDDSIIGGHGSDTLDGGQGDDFIDGSNLDALEIPDATDTVPENDRDLITGALGNDTLLGGDDDDTLIGGSGDDSLDGGIDEDSLLGGGGSDTILGGDGADTIDGGDDPDSIDGGDGRDRILIGSADEGNNDTIDGGSGVLDPTDPSESNPNNGDWDVLDLTGVGLPGTDWRLVNERPDSNGNGRDGTIEFLDGDGDVTGSFDFFEIEEIVPCFTPGTLIATPQGERLVEDLQPGDRIITRDNGMQEIRWVGRKEVSGMDLAVKPHLKPVLIRKGALGKGLPEHDMLVSPNHRVLVANEKTALYFEEREVLVAAKHLTGLDGVDEVEANGVAYIHIMFDQHEVVLSNGAWTESFQPGDYSLKGIGNAQRQEIFELFPELEQAEGLQAYGSARRSLKKHEAQLLTS